ncbi:uncharacterized protein LOC120344595 [Styela clava]
MNAFILTVTIFLTLQMCFAQEETKKQQKRMVCTMVDADEKNPIHIDKTGDEGLKVIPFKFSGAASILQSAMPFLKNIPRVDSPDEIPPLNIQTDRQNISMTCDVVSNAVNEQIKTLEDKVEKLNKLVEGIEDRSVCPGGVTYLDRCFRLMEIRGKEFSRPKSEDLCNFNGGVLAKLDSPLVYARVLSYVHDKFQDPKYGNRKVIIAWTGMTYHLATTTIPGLGPFSLPDAPDTKKLNEANKYLTWIKGHPKESLRYDQIAIQLRFRDPTRQKLVEMGAMTLNKWRRAIPLCQFQMKDWQDSDSTSARLFRFNF